MTERGGRACPAWLATLLLTAAVAAFLVPAALIMFSAFMIYDDEGYVLISLRNYIAHGALYRDVYTQYGPFPFLFYHGVNLLGIPLTHTAGRLITLLMWAGAAIGSAAFVAHATRSVLARLAVLGGVFVYLWIMSSEPTHPGGIIVCLIAVLAATGFYCLSNGRLTAWALVAGVAIALLILTKVNIGIFVAYATVTWWLLHHRKDGLRRWAPLVAGLWSALLPFLLMRSLWHVPWVQTYAIVFACSAVAAVIGSAQAAEARGGWPELIKAGLAGTLVGSLILGMVLLRGTHASDLVEGLLLGPLRQPVNFNVRYDWPVGISWLAFGSLVACVAARFWHRRHPARVDGAVAVVRLLFAAGVVFQVSRYPAVSPDYRIFGWAMPFIWTCAWPLGGDRSHRAAALGWTALLLLGQCLHSFPVPGSQIAWGSFLTLPVAAIGAGDAVGWFRRQPFGNWLSLRAIRYAGCAGMVTLIAQTGWNFAQASGRYRVGDDLGLPGAELIRVPGPTAAFLRILTQNASASISGQTFPRPRFPTSPTGFRCWIPPASRPSSPPSSPIPAPA